MAFTLRCFWKLLQDRWDQTSRMYNLFLEPGGENRAPEKVPYADLLRSDKGLPKKAPTSQSYSFSLYFLRLALEAIHKGMDIAALQPRRHHT